MSARPKIKSRRTRLLQGVVLAFVALAVAGCASGRGQLTTGSISISSKPVEQMNETELKQAAETVGAGPMTKAPKDRNIGLNYANVLRMSGRNAQALATIGRAQIPDRPDWRLKSAEGAILDQMRRAQEACGRYREALDSQPNEPSALSNLGMSYVLNGDLRTAETYLRSMLSQQNAWKKLADKDKTAVN